MIFFSVRRRLAPRLTPGPDLGREIARPRLNAITLCTRPSSRVESPDDAAASGYVSISCAYIGSGARTGFRPEKTVCMTGKIDAFLAIDGFRRKNKN